MSHPSEDPETTRWNSAARWCRKSSRVPALSSSGGNAVFANVIRGSSGISARRRNAATAGPVRHIRVPVVIFPAERDVLLGHVVKRDGRIPRLERISRILRKVRRIRGRRNRGFSVDRRQQHQIASRIVDFPAAQRQAEQVVMEPEAVVKHVSQKALLGAARFIAIATHAAAILAARIGGQAKTPSCRASAPAGRNISPRRCYPCGCAGDWG